MDVRPKAHALDQSANLDRMSNVHVRSDQDATRSFPDRNPLPLLGRYDTRPAERASPEKIRASLSIDQDRPDPGGSPLSGFRRRQTVGH
jgi:hypothetical protein